MQSDASDSASVYHTHARVLFILQGMATACVREKCREYGGAARVSLMLVALSTSAGCASDPPGFPSMDDVDAGSGNASGGASTVGGSAAVPAPSNQGMSSSSSLSGADGTRAGEGSERSDSLGRADVAECGDGVLHLGEACDMGEANSDEAPNVCRSDCTRPTCGDGVLDRDFGEECDEGPNNGTTCSVDCRAGCGNGLIEEGELCDDGDTNSNLTPDACRADCALPSCGDGVIDPSLGEQCDEGDRNSDAAASACRSNCQKHSCGDGIVDLDEGCDEGAQNSDSGDGCSTGCVLTSCGNGQLDPGEDCDEGPNNSDDVAGACRTNCRRAVCGDGVHDESEQCDEGSANSDTQPGACRTDCRSARCGDGTVDPELGEECDGGGNCTADCKALECGNERLDEGEECDPPDGETCDSECREIRCGDGRVQGDEQCEPNGQPDDTCSDECTRSTCGNGIVEEGEQCEIDLDHDCTSRCTIASCGDNVISGSEVCDDGENDGSYGGCMPGCTATAPYCGDGQRQESAGEECDLVGQNNGQYDGCTSDCKRAPFCGDGDVQADEGEQCDDGASQNTGAYDGCNPDCTKAPHCGDGETQAPEVCDDGAANGTPGANCNPTCDSKVNLCGNGTVDSSEQCDDGIQGNDGSYDGCTNSCQLGPRCGDDTVQADEGEECDDGEMDNTGGYGKCTSQCKRDARCGDGTTDGQHGEQCDDGDANNTGGYGKCNPQCEYDARCGDGTVQGDHQEKCDDGNTNDGDGCSSSCQCDAGFSACGGGCIDPATDEQYCGANFTCSNPGFVCQAGQECAYELCGDTSWSLESPLGGEDASNPLVAVLPDGKALAAWEPDGNRTGEIMGAIYTPGSGWSSPAPIIAEQSEAVRLVALEASKSGRAVAVMQNEDRTKIMSVHFSGSSWGSIKQVDGSTASDRDVTAAMSDEGLTHVAWRETNQIWAATFDATGVRVHLVDLTLAMYKGADAANDPVVAAGDETARVVWSHSEKDSTSNRRGVAVAVYRNGIWEGEYSAPSLFEEDIVDTNVVLIERDRFLVTWRLNGVLHSVGEYDDFSSTPKEVVDDSGIHDALRFTSSRNGVVFATWLNGDKVYVRKFENNQWQGSAQAISTAGASDHSIAAAQSGEALLAWTQDFQSENRIHVATFDGAVSKPRVLRAAEGNNNEPDVSCNASGQCMVVFEQREFMGSSYHQDPF